MNDFKKLIIEEEEKDNRTRKVIWFIFILILPIIGYVGIKFLSGMLGV
ncbi:MAG: hypothetical protein GVX78_03585 [Bacteroidetes bacterium]|jgi:hypothetical protein|nr:hypothetical protein [Bacteroidota bacterium]